MMAIPLNDPRFHDDFRNHPRAQAIVDRINTSPFMLRLFDRFKGKITIGDMGGFFSPVPENHKISFEKEWLDKLKDPNDPTFSAADRKYFDRFITVIAHELGHAVLPGGSNKSTDPKLSFWENLNTYMEEEGVAVYAEFMTAKELNGPMWSGNTAGLQKNLEELLATKYGGDITSKQFEKDVIAIGSAAYRIAHPSTAPFLNYDQKNSFLVAADLCQKTLTQMDINRIDWEVVHPFQIQITHQEDGSCRLDAQLPLKIMTEAQKEQEAQEAKLKEYLEQMTPPAEDRQRPWLERTYQIQLDIPNSSPPNHPRAADTIAEPRPRANNEFPAFFAPMLDAYRMGMAKAASEMNPPAAEKPAPPAREESNGPGF